MSKNWVASKLIEQDSVILEQVTSCTSKEKMNEINAVLENIKDGSLLTGNCKFSWIDSLLKNSVKNPTKEIEQNTFDKVATSKTWGKPLAIFIIFIGLLASMIIATPIMTIGFTIVPSLGNLLANFLIHIGCPVFVSNLINGVIFTSISFVTAMAGFIFGVSLVFGYIEEIGYMSRISFVFDSAMQKIGLHGKAIMPFIVSLGCNIGGTSGARIMDTWAQKVTTIAVSWIIPCGSTWGIIGLVSVIFFGTDSIFVIISLFIVAFLHMIITSKIFGRKLLKDSDTIGVIMELPPYHKAKWKHLFNYAIVQTWSAFIRALKVVVITSFIFWLLSYTEDNTIENSFIYKIGLFIEPVTMWLGLRWQMFTAWIIGGLGKEAALGALSALFSSEGVWESIALRGANTNTALVTNSLLATITKPEALAFLYAFFFNMPCLMTVGATLEETHSKKWTIRIVVYYVCVSLLMSALAYYVGLLIF